MDGDGAGVLQRATAGDVRAADADRERVAQRLTHAHAEGRLDLTEFDERVRLAWAACTYEDLRRVTADLPTERVPQRHADGPGDRRTAVAAWFSASLLNLVIWAVVCLATGSWVYPWWVWVTGPWGAVLLLHRVTGRSGGCDRPV